MRTLIRDNRFGPFYGGGHEFLRRVFVTVRDEEWQETPPHTWISTVDDTDGTAHVEARHTTPRLDVEWRGTLRLRDDARSGDFEFEAVARRTMSVCRLGLVVLHPVNFMVDARIYAQGPHGSHSIIIARTIASQPIVEGVPGAMTPSFSALTIEHEGIGRLTLKFEGDLFELEDQRNWGDASFKTYCTPLRLGFPRTIEAGTEIRQRLQWQFTATTTASATRKHRMPSATHGIVPRIGRGWSNATTQSQAQDWHYLHRELGSPDDLAAVSNPSEERPVRSLQIAVAEDVSDECFAKYADWIALRRDRIARSLIYGLNRGIPSEANIVRWRSSLAERQAGPIQVIAATRGYFVEFNRASSALDFVADGIAFPHTTTVHSDDPATITDNVSTIQDMAATARLLTRASTLILAPLALYYPAAQPPRSFSHSLAGPWLTATLIHAAAAGISAVTLGDDVIEATEPALLASLLRLSGSRVTLLIDEERPKLHVALFHGDDAQAELVAANLDQAPTTLDVNRWSPSLEPSVLESYRVLTVRGERDVPPQSVLWLD
jgi:D-apionolactonase